jgi:hypothetical protein
VSVINPNNGSIVCSLEVGIGSKYTLFDPFNNNIYVSSSVSGTLSIISPLNNAPKVYTIDFIESGLSSGVSWGIIFNGMPKNSTSNSVEFFALNGTYSYTVENVSGYLTQNYTSKINVAGSSVTSQIIFNKKVTAPSISSMDEYILAGTVVVVAAIAISILTIRRKKPT